MRGPRSYVTTGSPADLDAAGGTSTHAPDAQPPADAFHDPLMGIVAAALFLAAVAMAIALGFGYWAVQYDRPSWNVHSVPPPDAPY